MQGEFEGLNIEVYRATDGKIVIRLDTGNMEEGDHDKLGSPTMRVYVNDHQVSGEELGEECNTINNTISTTT